MRLRFRHLVVVMSIVGCTDGRSLTVPGAGTGGHSGGAAGAAGADASAGPVARIGALCPGPTHASPCPELPPCWNTCGPARSGFKNCACDAAGRVVCGDCHYDPDADTSCFALPDPVPACPADPTDGSGMQLPASGAACSLEACQPCGSNTAPAYRDSSGAPKVGFCVCVINAETGLPAYSCASLKDWPR